ncbi:rhodanese-like domain-containing protein [Parapedobacter koreensis]|uniref:Rhodanese-related sulfurtransferase n=1 Tax=Parapedobacter koreensis TaxID=332977 RepID=A0A1H7MP53_9SPHI|nr:rhodanese-like domain-containing protein [Parapedobacter koreensis]SEL12881.1 Rhodanese-related sulfurtransferase [Parapedobacter koreensis]
MMRLFVTLMGLALGNGQQDTTLNPEFATWLNRAYRHTVPTITTTDLKTMMKQGVVILDTREQTEFDISHMKHARHVGYVWFDMRKVYDIPKTDTIVVYCAIGNRSERIGEKLQKAGYQHVYNLFGGIYEWINQYNPVYNASNIQTTEIHVYDVSWARWLQNGSRRYDN